MSHHTDRFLLTLQRLLEIPAADLGTALTQASNAIADALEADKLDAFLYDDTRDSLVALGTSTQPLSDLQKRLGLDVLPLSNGGRVAHVYRTGEPCRIGNVQDDPEELRGIKEGLRVCSHLGVPLEVAGARRGVLMAASLQRDFFTEADLAFTSSAARWVGIVAEHAELVQSIERSAVELGRTSRAEEIVAVLAHDIRNYLAPVMLRLYNLRKRADLDKRTTDIADANGALQGLSRLSALVSDLLDTTRLDAGAFEMRLQPISLTDLVHEAASTMTTPEHAVLVHASSALIVNADPSRLRQCIDNVLSNAVAYSPTHAPVSVFVTEKQADGRMWAHVDIVDEGPGVPEAMVSKLFEPFVSSRGAGGGGGGVGLGLYIAKRIATAHGGDLTVERPASKGARFTIRIPAVDRE